jgi:hypothetical protein
MESFVVGGSKLAKFVPVDATWSLMLASHLERPSSSRGMGSAVLIDIESAIAIGPARKGQSEPRCSGAAADYSYLDTPLPWPSPEPSEVAIAALVMSPAEDQAQSGQVALGGLAESVVDFGCHLRVRLRNVVAIDKSESHWLSSLGVVRLRIRPGSFFEHSGSSYYLKP